MSSFVCVYAFQYSIVRNARFWALVRTEASTIIALVESITEDLLLSTGQPDRLGGKTPRRVL